MRYALVTASPLLEINTQIDASNLIAGLGNEFVMPYVHPNVHFTIISKENYNEIKSKHPILDFGVVKITLSRNTGYS